MRGQMFIQDNSGHTTIEWDTTQQNTNGPLDPAVAEKKFNQMIRRGAFAFATDAQTGENVQTRRFPGESPRVTVVPQYMGG